MNDENQKKSDRSEEWSPEQMKAWLKQFKEALPESWQSAADQTGKWVKENPNSALAIGTAAGVSLAFLGVGRIAKGAHWAIRHPVVGALAMKAVSGVVDGLARPRGTRKSSEGSETDSSISSSKKKPSGA
jgi:hypothetical protein